MQVNTSASAMLPTIKKPLMQRMMANLSPILVVNLVWHSLLILSWQIPYITEFVILCRHRIS